MASRVEGLDRTRDRVLRRLPAAAREKVKAANDKNADEFMGLVRRAIPAVEVEGREIHLIDTLVKEEVSETGFSVSIGGPQAPYPLHLEGGHRAADGSHVPAKPGWNPAKRVIRKRAKGRSARAMNAALKQISAEG
jgi:hypothetical protein